jgi:NAD(P)-dependent dehydrogenase (short-subunit alcohol dehydrogenase family)
MNAVENGPSGPDMRPSRRRLLGAAGIGAATGVVAGLAAGAVLAQPPGPIAVIRRTDAPRFLGKVVLITGATSGIGRAAAIAFAAEGARVCFCGRREALGHTVEQEIRAAGGEASYIRADVRVEEDVKAFVDRAMALYGRLDVALNNAGITIELPLHEYAAAEWDDVINTNLRGVFLAMKYQIPPMIAGGGGNIVVTSSSNAIATQARRGAYTASKRGLIGLVQAAALDYAPHGVRVNALVPGTTDTPLVRRSAGMEGVPDAVWQIGAREWAKTHCPGLQRMAQPEEIASAALMLASADHPYMTGAAFVIDGGKTAQAG